MIDTEQNARVYDHFICSITGMEFVAIPGGMYVMGDIWGDLGEECQPPHEVRVCEFHLAKYPVTQFQWQAIMGGENPALRSGDDFVGTDKPVVNVSWEDAQAFIDRLKNKVENRFSFRLPSEAEWEYASRSCGGWDKWAGTSNWESLKEYSHYSLACPEHGTDKVGQRCPNAAGLYDMSGNVSEWCQDMWHNNYIDGPHDGIAWGDRGLTSSSGVNYRVVRGGNWFSGVEGCRSANRSKERQNCHRCGIGFRLAFGLT